ncbi:MAG: hypothetical protein HOF57_00295 [Euryarchaeota archaeon]|jgi:hypothetical protein|nr:hypothetical protein [Euryarchaeota archaeon]MBT4475253.1 hypothetical protein [Euryarchaeota archaeon]
MAAGGAIATLTVLGAFAFVALVIGNWYFFSRQEMGFLEWLRNATLWQRLAVLVDVIFTVLGALDFLTILFVLL